MNEEEELILYDEDLGERTLIRRLFNEIKNVEVKEYLLCKIPDYLKRVPFDSLPFSELQNESYLYWAKLPVEKGLMICEDGKSNDPRFSDPVCGEFDSVKYGAKCRKCERCDSILADFHTHWNGSLFPSRKDLSLMGKNSWKYYMIGGVLEGREVINIFEKKTSISWASISNDVAELMNKSWTIRKSLPILERSIVIDPSRTKDSCIVGVYRRESGIDTFNLNRRLTRLFSNYFKIGTFVRGD